MDSGGEFRPLTAFRAQNRAVATYLGGGPDHQGALQSYFAQLPGGRSNFIDHTGVNGRCRRLRKARSPFVMAAEMSLRRTGTLVPTYSDLARLGCGPIAVGGEVRDGGGSHF